ncbi:MAG TPA: L,D-transpeptidase [Spirochaetota bacterium]|nr:L,D-transpeptidase [Spirochaetota bacterium]HPI88149.1 L,D-transpeptidase [Spirochaetota bacterium]HPR47924.1 L,D-transpeptidase [Spirochaetota bacterium]
MKFLARINSIIFTVALCLCAAALTSCSAKTAEMQKAFESFKGNYIVFVSKKNFMLEVYDRKMIKVAVFRIAYGLNPDGGQKMHAGDNRTPEGTYRITEILSMDADKKSSAYSKLRDMNSTYFKAADGHSKYGHPDVDLGYNAYGPRFFRLNYPVKEDVERYNRAVKNGIIKPINGKIPGIGSGIAIHGNADEASIGHLSSSGCIRLYNTDLVKLDQFIIIGTPVLISAD